MLAESRVVWYFNGPLSQRCISGRQKRRSMGYTIGGRSFLKLIGAVAASGTVRAQSTNDVLRLANVSPWQMRLSTSSIHFTGIAH